MQALGNGAKTKGKATGAVENECSPAEEAQGSQGQSSEDAEGASSSDEAHLLLDDTDDGENLELDGDLDEDAAECAERSHSTHSVQASQGHIDPGDACSEGGEDEVQEQDRVPQVQLEDVDGLAMQGLQEQSATLNEEAVKPEGRIVEVNESGEEKTVEGHKAEEMGNVREQSGPGIVSQQDR